MKKSVFSFCVIMLTAIIALYSLYASAQSINGVSSTSSSVIHLQFQNNSWLPGKFTLKIKSSDTDRYGVVSFKLFSFQKYKGEYTPGASIYLIDENEQQTLMQGGEASGKFLLEVKAADEGKIIKLVP